MALEVGEGPASTVSWKSNGGESFTQGGQQCFDWGGRLLRLDRADSLENSKRVEGPKVEKVAKHRCG